MTNKAIAKLSLIDKVNIYKSLENELLDAQEAKLLKNNPNIEIIYSNMTIFKDRIEVNTYSKSNVYKDIIFIEEEINKK